MIPAIPAIPVFRVVPVAPSCPTQAFGGPANLVPSVLVPHGFAYPLLSLPDPRSTEMLATNLPSLSETDESSIQTFLDKPINIQLHDCSFAFPIVPKAVFSELLEFAQKRLGIHAVRFEFSGPSVLQALGTHYLLRCLESQNIEIEHVYPMEEKKWPVYINICIPSTSSTAPNLCEGLKHAFFRIIGQKMPLLQPAQIKEGEAVLRSLGIPLVAESAANFRITLAEHLFEKSANLLKVKFLADQQEDGFSLSFNTYLTSDKASDLERSPQVKFGTGGFPAFLKGVVDCLTIPSSDHDASRRSLSHESQKGSAHAYSPVVSNVLTKDDAMSIPLAPTLEEACQQKINDLIALCKESDGDADEKRQKCIDLFYELKNSTLPSYDSLLSARMASEFLFHPAIKALFFKLNKGDYWHQLLLTLVPQNFFPEANAFCCELFTITIELLYESPGSLTKKTLQSYHANLHTLLSTRFTDDRYKSTRRTLTKTLFKHLPALFSDYREHRLYREACELMEGLHLDRNILFEYEESIESCLKVLVDRAKTYVHHPHVMFDIDHFLKKIPFLTMVSSHLKIAEKQAELSLLLAEGFLTVNPQKSQELFQAVIKRYPKLLCESRFAESVTLLVQERYEEIGFAVVMLVLQAVKQNKSPSLGLEWAPCFTLVITYLLRKKNLQKVYRILYASRNLRPKTVLSQFAFAWLDSACYENVNAPQAPTISEIFIVLRSYASQDPELWEKFLKKAKDAPVGNLAPILHTVEQFRMLDTQPDLRIELWKITVNNSTAQQLCGFLEHQRALFGLFKGESLFFIRFMNRILGYLEGVNTSKEPFLSLLWQLHGLVSHCSLTPHQKVDLNILSIRLKLLESSTASFLQVLGLTNCFGYLLANNKEHFESFPYFHTYLKRAVDTILGKQQSIIPQHYVQFTNEFQKLLPLFPSQAGSPDYLMSCLLELLPLLTKYPSYLDSFAYCWTALCARFKKESPENSQPVNFSAAHAILLGFLQKELRAIDGLWHGFNDLVLNENVLFLFSPSQRADLLAIIASVPLRIVDLNSYTYTSIRDNHFPIILRFASSDYKKFFCENLFSFYLRHNERNFFYQVDFAKSVLRLELKRENRITGNNTSPLGALEVEIEFEKRAILHVSTCFGLLPTQKMRLDLFNESVSRFVALLQTTKNPGQDRDLSDIFEKIFYARISFADKNRVGMAKQLLLDLDRGYQFFPAEREQQLCSLYGHLLELDPSIGIPLDRFSAHTLCAVLSEKITTSVQQKHVDPIARLTFCLNTLAIWQPHLINKIFADKQLKTVDVLAQAYEALFILIKDEVSKEQEQALNMMFLHLYQLFSHVGVIVRETTPNTQKNLADFILRLSMCFLTGFHSYVEKCSQNLQRLKEYPHQSNYILSQAEQQLYIAYETFVIKFGLLSDFIFHYAKLGEPVGLRSIKKKVENELIFILSYRTGTMPSLSKYVTTIFKKARSASFLLANAEDAFKKRKARK